MMVSVPGSPSVQTNALRFLSLNTPSTQSMKDKCLPTSTVLLQTSPCSKGTVTYEQTCWNDWTADFNHFYFKGLNKNISSYFDTFLFRTILNKSIVFDIWIYPLPKVHNRWTSLELKLKVSTSVTEATQQNVSLSNNLPINCSIYLLWTCCMVNDGNSAWHHDHAVSQKLKCLTIEGPTKDSPHRTACWSDEIPGRSSFRYEAWKWWKMLPKLQSKLQMADFLLCLGYDSKRP